MHCKASDEGLSEGEAEGSHGQQAKVMVVVAEAGGDDEDDGEGCGDGVEQVELGDGYVVDAHELLLKGLRLVEDEVVSEHHHDQQQSQPSAACH